MKNYAIITLLLAFLSITLFADENHETLFGNGEVTWGGYGAPDIKFSTINSEFALLLGGRGGVIINNSFIIGIAGYGVVTSHKLDDYFISGLPDTNAYLRMGYGGLCLGFIINPQKIIHITTSLLIGGGGALYTRAYLQAEPDYWNKHRFTYESSPFMIIEPGIGAELNITKFMRFEVGASYRMISFLDLPKTAEGDISGLSGYISFKFGKF